MKAVVSFSALNKVMSIADRLLFVPATKMTLSNLQILSNLLSQFLDSKSKEKRTVLTEEKQEEKSECDCMKCEFTRTLDKLFKASFLDFLTTVVDKEFAPSEIVNRKRLIFDILAAIVSSTFNVIEQFENYLKKRDPTFQMNTLFMLLIRIIASELQERNIMGVQMIPINANSEFLKVGTPPVSKEMLN